MNAKDILDLYNQFKQNDIKIWIDGGWGVDALLEKQTRPHADLDIAINRKDVEKLRRLLDSKGFVEKHREDSSEWNFVLEDILV